RISTTGRPQLLGQGVGIRGWAYLGLVRVWGGVPIITEPTDRVGQNVGSPRATAEETYLQVLSDLNEAEGLLPSTTDRFSITKKTVQTLKARYFLYRKEWQQAQAYASLLIDDPEYELVNPY